MMLSWTRLPCSFSFTTCTLCGMSAGSLPPTAWSSACGIIARTRPIGVVSDETFVISPPKRVVSETVPAYLRLALRKLEGEPLCVVLLADFVHRRGQVDDNQAEGRLFARSADNAVLEIHGHKCSKKYSPREVEWYVLL